MSRQQSPTPTRGIARHGRLRRNPWGTFGKVIASIVAVVVVSVLGIGGVAAVNLVSGAHKTVHLAGEQAVPSIAALKGGVNILMVASDTRSNQGDAWGPLDDSEGLGNNDDNMLIHLSANHQNLTIVQFPRDMELPVPACGAGNPEQDSAMLNSTLSEGGLSCVVATIEQLTGINIPFAGLVTFDGVVAMSNAVGGVQVCIGGQGIDDPDTSLNLPPGEVTLQGADAAEFLRTRHGVGDGSDLARLSNQQVFFSALARKMLDAGTLTNPVELWGLAKATVSNVQLSDNFTLTNIYQIAQAMHGLSFSNITFVQYPVLQDPDDSDRVIPDTDSGQTLDQAIAADQPVAITAGVGNGSVQTSGTPIAQPSATPSPSASKSDKSKSGSTPSATASPSQAAVPLSNNVFGQTAATQTCSNGSGGDE
jgi:LCP family protein required for cell wall assembly